MTLSVLNSVGCNDKLVPCHRLPFIYIRLYHQHLVEPSGHARRSRPSSVARHPSPVARRPSPVEGRPSKVGAFCFVNLVMYRPFISLF